MVFLLNPKVAAVVNSKNISSKERLELWLFATFILSHTFPENFIETPHIVEKL